ncbi:MAG: hypothetical protein BWX79_03183 [Alphaproteobacteria bacterium ADurb.Bin100]|nr:MAG: hypothetical protein BWX79_03183 [Alphaproteobacteria bacterium ADurb.Bin100]
MRILPALEHLPAAGREQFGREAAAVRRVVDRAEGDEHRGRVGVGGVVPVQRVGPGRGFVDPVVGAVDARIADVALKTQKQRHVGAAGLEGGDFGLPAGCGLARQGSGRVGRTHGRDDGRRALDLARLQPHAAGAPALHFDAGHGGRGAQLAAGGPDGGAQAFGKALRPAHRVPGAVGVAAQHGGVKHQRRLDRGQAVVAAARGQQLAQDGVLDLGHGLRHGGFRGLTQRTAAHPAHQRGGRPGQAMQGVGLHGGAGGFAEILRVTVQRGSFFRKQRLQARDVVRLRCAKAEAELAARL